MRMRFITAALAITTSAAAAVAQQHGGHQPQHQAPKHAQPYAGQQAREVASLSAEELRDLKAGRGMGLAKAAEVNGHPGPAHVLELADELQLTPSQRDAVNGIRGTIKSAAVTAKAPISVPISAIASTEGPGTCKLVDQGNLARCSKMASISNVTHATGTAPNAAPTSRTR